MRELEQVRKNKTTTFSLGFFQQKEIAHSNVIFVISQLVCTLSLSLLKNVLKTKSIQMFLFFSYRKSISQSNFTTLNAALSSYTTFFHALYAVKFSIAKQWVVRSNHYCFIFFRSTIS